ncbi:MAG: hypothetical protein AB1489_31885 [Acidobacteriota bacterium]
MQAENSKQKPLWRLILTLFLVSVFFSYPWELAQSPLYICSDTSTMMWWHCFLASLGDGTLILLIFFIGYAVFGKPDWFEAPGASGYTVMLVAGAMIGASVEWVAVSILELWAYNSRMPLVPGLKIGITPSAQMLILPPLIFHVATLWIDRNHSTRAKI